MRLFWLVVGIFILPFSVAFAEAEKSPPGIEDFLAWSDFWSAELSPSGRYVAGVQRSGFNHILVIQDLDSPDSGVTGSRMGEFAVNWIEWITDDRLLVSLTVYTTLSGDPVTMEQFHDVDFRRDEFVLGSSRLVSMDRYGGDVAVMFSDDMRMLRRNFRGSSVVSFLPNEPDYILMPARKSGDLDLFKVNVHTGESERIATGTDRTFAWYVDRDGEPAFRYNSNRRGSIIYIYARQDRSNGSIRWRRVKTIRLNRGDETRDAATEFRPLAAGEDLSTYIVAARPEGENETAIWLYDFESDTFLEKVAGVDGIDVEVALFERETKRFQGISYEVHRREYEFEDPAVQAHFDGLAGYFGEQTNVIPLNSSRDGRRWLIHSYGPDDPGSYHVYDLDAAFVTQFGFNRLSLVEKALGKVELIEYQARDGMALHGYLTRPASWQPGDPPPPLIMMPHGGPEARDRFSFNDDAQLLAAHGYQVFQPNFRGSSGFGRAFADAGRRQWGKAMQTDVDDAYAHLVNEGLADDDRACIFGHSYGGYVALAAATLTPELYRCVISINGVSHLEESLKRERREEGRNSEVFEYWTEHIGDLRRDRDELLAYSPAMMADRVVRPVLLVFSTEDTVVFPEQTEMMHEALEEAGKSVTLLELEDSGHAYRTTGDQRREYKAIMSFLAEHLPLEAPDTAIAVEGEVPLVQP